MNVCRSDESARLNERVLNGQASVSTVTKDRRRQGITGSTVCGACGRANHNANETCPAIGKTCHTCNAVGHFSPCCPSRDNQSNKDKREKSSKSAKLTRIEIKNVNRLSLAGRQTPKITLHVNSSPSGGQFIEVRSITPDPGAEVSVAGMEILKILGLSVKDLQQSQYDLVQADGLSTLRVNLGSAMAQEKLCAR